MIIWRSAYMEFVYFSEPSMNEGTILYRFYSVIIIHE